jgi:hypothetical protein
MTHPHEHEHPPTSLKDFYGELRQLVEQGYKEPYDLAIADRVETLVLRHLAQLKGQLIQQQAGMLADFIVSIADLGKRIPVGDFDDEGFLSAFGHAWGGYLEQRLREPVARDFLALTHAGLAASSKESATVLSGLRKQRQDLIHQATEKEALQATADFKQRRELGNELALLRNRLGEVEHGIATAEMNALRNLLPPGTDYEHLAADTSALALDPAKLHPSAIAALFFWQDHQDGAEVGTAWPTAQAVAPARPAPNQPEPAAEIPVAAVSSLRGEDADEEWLQALRAGAGKASGAKPAEAAEAEPQPALAAPAEAAPGPEPASPPAAAQPKAAQGQPYTADCEEAIQRFGEAYRDRSPDLGTAVENVAFHWIDRGYINVAYTTLKSAQFSHLPIPRLLSPDLFKAAYFGMNVWSRDDEALATSQRLLNFLSLPMIDELCGRRPGGPAIPYLLLAASFQPALFGGALTTAPAILEYASHFLGEPFRRRLGELTGLCGNDGALSLEIMRKLPSGDAKAARSQFAARLADWRDRILNKQSGWGPARTALSNCLARNDFDRAIKAIETPDSNDEEGVSAFIAKYRDKNAVGALMETQIATLLSALESRPVEEKNAKSWFVLNVLDLCGIANDWLAERRLRRGAASTSASLIDRVVSPMAGMREDIEQSIHPGLPFEQRVCAKLAAQRLAKLRLAIEDTQSNVVWSAKQTNAWLSLPYDMMEAVGFSGDAEGELTWLVDRLSSVPPAAD